MIILPTHTVQTQTTVQPQSFLIFCIGYFKIKSLNDYFIWSLVNAPHPPDQIGYPQMSCNGNDLSCIGEIPRPANILSPYVDFDDSLTPYSIQGSASWFFPIFFRVMPLL